MIPGLNPTPDPNQVTPPNAQAVLGGAQNAQAAPNAPAPQAPQISQQPTQQPASLPITPALARNAMTGAGFHALMGTHGQVGPDGTVVQTPNNTGQLFRSILAGAITGMAAGAQAKMGGGIGSVAVGAGAAQQQGEQNKERLQQQSQQQFQNQQELSKEQLEKDNADREKTLTNAQIANFQAETIARQHQMDLQDKEYTDRHNEANRALYNTLEAAGGTPPPEHELPATIGAYDLAKLYTSTNGKIRQPADQNMTRHFIDTTSAEEVSWDPNKKIWVEEDGKPADMTNKTEFRVLDVPRNNMTQKISTPNKDIFSALGFTVPGMDPKGSTMIAPSDMISLRANRMKDERESRGAEIQDRQNKIAEYNAAEGRVTRDNEGLKDQIAELKDNPVADPDGSRAATLNSRLDQNTQWLDEQYDTIWGTKKAKTTGTAPPPAHDPIQATVDTLKGKTPQEIQAALDDPKNGVPEAVKPQIWKKLGIAPPPPKSYLNPMGQAVVRGVQAIAPAIQTGLTAVQ